MPDTAPPPPPPVVPDPPPARPQDPQRWPRVALRGLVVAAFVAVNAVVFYNARWHDPGIGYDSDAHVHYLMALSRGRLPTSADTGEFFSPPLPYVPGAVAMAMGEAPECAFKIAQYAHVAYSVVLTFFLLRLCGFVRRGDDRLGLLALLCLGMVPAYYKTFAMIRGEPLLATLAVVVAWLAVRTFVVKERMSLAAAAGLGLLLGAAALSRQWGIFLIPPVMLLAAWRMRRDRAFWPAFRTLAVAGVFCAVSGSWYYLYLHHTYGSMTAFNRAPERVDRPASFWVAFPVHKVVANPVRPLDPTRRLLPILYSDFWGDYWLHFLVYGRNRQGRYMQGVYITRKHETAMSKRPVEQNLAAIAPYLRRINAVSLLPTLVLFAGAAAGLVAIVRVARSRAGAANPPSAADPPDVAGVMIAFAAAVVFCTLGGYLWFLVNYTDASGDTIKATYVLQTVPFLALLAAVVLRGLLARRPRAAAVLIVLLLAVTAHNAPAMITRYERDSSDACRARAPAPAPAPAPATSPVTPASAPARGSS